MLMNSYCHADTHEQAQWLHDDIGMRASTFDPYLTGSLQQCVTPVRRTANHGSAVDRVRRLATQPANLQAMSDGSTRTRRWARSSRPGSASETMWCSRSGTDQRSRR
jgi:hypothetical protein